MESIYEVVETDKGEILKRTDVDGSIWWIPIDESNSDYQRYLNPQAEHLNGSVDGETL